MSLPVIGAPKQISKEVSTQSEALKQFKANKEEEVSPRWPNIHPDYDNEIWDYYASTIAAAQKRMNTPLGQEPDDS